MAFKRRHAFLGAASAISRHFKRRRTVSSKSSRAVSVSNKLKQSRSFTRTNTKSKRKVGRVIQDGTGTSKSFTTWSNKKAKFSKMIKWLDNPQIYEKFNEFIMETDVSGTETPGVQAAYNCSALLNSTDMVAMQNQILNIASTNNTAGADPAFLPDFRTSQKAFKLFVESAEQYVLFTNVTNASIVVDIYDCVAKRDNASNYQPTDQWEQGQAVDEAGILTNQSSVTLRGTGVPFSVPQSSRVFNQFYTVKKHVRVELAQGRTHEHTHKHIANKMVDMSMLNTTGSYIVKGVTSYVLLVIRGQPCTIGNNSIPTANNGVTLAEARAACVTRTRYRWRLGSTTPTIYNNSGLPLPTAYGGNSIVNIVSEGAGLPELFSQT